ncbi:MAG: 50S ribosomal protein L5 [Waddliaceae bacterium]|nr:50S ribosomal protein L5 [Waddliaceae bacterium]
MSGLKEYYNSHIRGAMQEKYGYTNSMLVPKLLKVVISMGIAEASKDKNAVQDCIKELSVISGQKPQLMKARQSISNFKLREGQTIGLKVTLRGERMYDFMLRWSHVICPRIRDFRGLPSKCDGRGNYSVGIDDQQIFPEINLDEVKRTQGMNITFVTSATNDEECVELLRLMGMPFKDKPVSVATAA